MEKYLCPTSFIDSTHTLVIDFTEKITKDCQTDVEKVVAIYYAVRDQILYDPYRVVLTPEGMCASNTLKHGKGYCVEKAIVMAAAARYLGIPSLLGFANVRNHLASEKFIEALKTDVFVFHGYVSVFLDGKWVKSTPAFNKSLCDRFKVLPLEFDGKRDSIFQEYDADGSKYMEYLTFHGEFADMPLDLFDQELRTFYPHIFEKTTADLKWQ